MKQLNLALDNNKSAENLFEIMNLNQITSSKKKYNVLELFSGAGGLALGLHAAGLNPVGLVDIDSAANKTIKKNFPNWNVIEENIEDVAKIGINNYLKSNENIDLLTGGFPCQPFSYAGKRMGLEDVRGTVFFSLAKIINDVNPKVFILENVKGLLSHDNGRTFKTVITILEDLNYKVEYKVLNAWDYNVPQKRERIFIVGVKKGYTSHFKWPKTYSYKPVLKDVLFDVKDSLGSSYPKQKKAVMDLVPPGGCWINLPEDVAKSYMGASYFSGGGKRGMARRLSYDEPSLTLTTSPAQKQTERCHPAETRPFTTREYARIQTFPDDYEFQGSVSAIYRQIGNAVPVNLAYEIGKSVVLLLDNINLEIYETLDYKLQELYPAMYRQTDNSISYGIEKSNSLPSLEKNVKLGEKEMNWNLSFITKEDYTTHVSEYFDLINNSIKPKNVEEFNRNIIDPIKLTFSYFITGEDVDYLIDSEMDRQVDKTINNHIGYFHQNIFKYINGWHVPNTGFDIVNNEETIFVELKNKHNTMNSSSSQKTYIKMQDKVIESLERKIDVTCMLVEIIATRSQNIEWVVSVDGQRKSKQSIRRVSIDKFYEIVTGDQFAFKKLVSWLPLTLKEIMINKNPELNENTVVEQLTKERSFFINLYNLAFETYAGFDDLNFIRADDLGEDFK